MNFIPAVIYMILFLAALGYGGLIVYHVIRYKSELYDGQVPQVIAAMWFYIIISGSILLLSFVLAGLGAVILP
ncbi:MAG: hypothetical protein WC805_02925 [Patescibacteria group bacterium]|jgi:hypothetical protein